MSNNSFDLLKTFFTWSGIIIASVIIFVLLFRLIADISLRRHRKTFQSKNPKLFESIIESNNYLKENQKTYLVCAQNLGFNQTINCSSAIVNNSTLNPTKYILKYAYLEHTTECMARLDYLESYMSRYSAYEYTIDNAWKKYKQNTPFMFRLFISRHKAANILCGIKSKIKLSYPYLYFLYISPAGKTRRGHKIIVDEKIIAELRSEISSKITKQGHVKEQRSAMTKDLREAIKQRDNFTCQICGNSVLKEPNLLLEVDHIVPVSKGGKTEADNLQTLCWRCNRSKSNKE